MPHVDLKLGQIVALWDEDRAIVKYIGRIRGVTDIEVGFEYFDLHGFCDGTWRQERYFECPSSLDVL
jgi:dynactin complex subunit